MGVCGREGCTGQGWQSLNWGGGKGETLLWQRKTFKITKCTMWICRNYNQPLKLLNPPKKQLTLQAWMFYRIPFNVFYLNCSLNILLVHGPHYQGLQFAFTVKQDRKKCWSHYSDQVCIMETFVACFVLTPQLLTPVCHCTQTLHSIIRPANTRASQALGWWRQRCQILCIYTC